MLDFMDANGSIGSGMLNGWTPTYCALEVAKMEP
jgi:hypothetical protein